MKINYMTKKGGKILFSTDLFAYSIHFEVFKGERNVFCLDRSLDKVVKKS